MDTARPTILVVEDEPAIAHLLCAVLEEEGYTCVSAGSADVALTALETMTPALITLDLSLPGMNGRVLLQHIRAREATRTTPVIIVSADSRSDPSLRASSQAILIKPFELDLLVAMVRRTL